MPKFITVTTFYQQHPGVVARMHGDATREGHRAMGEVWKEDLAIEHFDPRARLIFKYQPRTAKWRKYKKAMAAVGKAEDGGETDLVFSGRARRLVKNATVAATANKTTVTHFMPVYFGRPRWPRSPVLRREMTEVSPRQEQILSRAGMLAYYRRLAKLPAAKTTRTS